jgi:hypothetical protein
MATFNFCSFVTIFEPLGMKFSPWWVAALAKAALLAGLAPWVPTTPPGDENAGAMVHEGVSTCST